MRNPKGYAIICYIISSLYFLSILLMSEGTLLNKQGIFNLAMGGIWLFLGVIQWRNKNKRNTKEKI